MKVLILLSLATVAVASVYEVPVVKTVVVDSYEPSIVVSPKVSSGLYLQSVGHPALQGLHYPVQKYVSHYPSGLYHGPHGLGIYNPKLHDELEEAYYRG